MEPRQIAKLLQERDRFVIAGHIGPDGDTIGSCFGLAMALRKLGKKAVVMLESFAEKYNIIPGKEYLYRGTEPLEMDVFIALDCADVERLGAARAFFDKAYAHKGKTTVCIDHHETNDGFAEYNFIQPQASSTAEMVFAVIEALLEYSAIDIPIDKAPIDKDIARAIYAGIVGDTGGFRYSSTSRSTMSVAARLMETGIPFTDIYSEVLHKHSFEAAKAFGIALENATSAIDGRLVYTFITKEMLAAVGADSSDMDSVVEYLMNTRGAEVAVFFYERHQVKKDNVAGDDSVNPGSTAISASGIGDGSQSRKIKVSMRSRGLHVGRIAAALGGGGHRMAAGCTIVGTMDSVMRQVLESLVENVAEKA